MSPDQKSGLSGAVFEASFVVWPSTERPREPVQKDETMTDTELAKVLKDAYDDFWEQNQPQHEHGTEGYRIWLNKQNQFIARRFHDYLDASLRASILNMADKLEEVTKALMEITQKHIALRAATAQKDERIDHLKSIAEAKFPAYQQSLIAKENATLRAHNQSLREALKAVLEDIEARSYQEHSASSRIFGMIGGSKAIGDKEYKMAKTALLLKTL